MVVVVGVVVVVQTAPRVHLHHARSHTWGRCC